MESSAFRELNRRRGDALVRIAQLVGAVPGKLRQGDEGFSILPRQPFHLSLTLSLINLTLSYPLFSL